MSRKNKKYTQEYKQEAVALALKSPSISAVAKSLGLGSSTLHKWVAQLKSEQPTSNPSIDTKALLEENRRLHKELAIAKEEKEILKKAAAYFAQHQK